MNFTKYNDPATSDLLFSNARGLRKGDLFMSDRPDEGLVEVLYDYGKCPHDDRPDSVYVRQYGTKGDGIWSASWFISIPADWIVYLTRKEDLV